MDNGKENGNYYLWGTEGSSPRGRISITGHLGMYIYTHVQVDG